MIKPDDLIAEARSWLDVPFLHQGRSRHGIDCIGLAIVVGKACGLLPKAYDMRAYPRQAPAGVMVAELDRLFTRTGVAVPGTIITCRFNSEPQHIAIVSQDRHGPTLIHALANVGKVAEHGYDAVWRRVTCCIHTIPGVDYGC